MKYESIYHYSVPAEREAINAREITLVPSEQQSVHSFLSIFTANFMSQYIKIQSVFENNVNQDQRSHDKLIIKVLQ